MYLARGAADGIESRTPAEMLGGDPALGWSAAKPQDHHHKKHCRARGAADRGRNLRIIIRFDCRPLRGLRIFSTEVPGVALRSTPGFTLSAAPRAKANLSMINLIRPSFSLWSVAQSAAHDKLKHVGHNSGCVFVTIQAPCTLNAFCGLQVCRQCV